MAVSYECRQTLPAFTFSYPPDWRLDTSQVAPNQGRLVLATEDGGAELVISWGPATTLPAVLQQVLAPYPRHQLGPNQRSTVNWISWQEAQAQVWKDVRAAHGDQVAVRHASRSGASWSIVTRVAAAQATRRRSALELILKSFAFMPGATPPEPGWRHHRYMANAVEFAFNQPGHLDVVPEVRGEDGTCRLEFPGGGSFIAAWGPALDGARYLDALYHGYREHALVLERPGLRLRSGTWSELSFDGLRAPVSGWDAGGAQQERGRFRHGSNAGLGWVIGYLLPHATLGALQPWADRMLASMRILGLQDAPQDEVGEGRGLMLELGTELGLVSAPRASLEWVSLADRITQELPVMRVLLAYEGVLLPHLAVRAHPEMAPYGYRIRLGGQTLLERDLLKGDHEPLAQILEELRAETPRLDGILTPRIARPELIQQLFPRSPNAYEKLRALRPELALPALPS